MIVYVLGPNLNNQSKGNFIAHLATCADVPRERHRNPDAYGDRVDAASRIDVARSLYPPDEFDWDGTEEQSAPYVGDIWFAPCLKEMK